MNENRSREALRAFLDYLSDKGLMARATVEARKAAASVILGILDEHEASDVTALDLDDVVARFQRLHGQRYTPQSLVTYKGRLTSAINDFGSYLANPLAFRPSVAQRGRGTAKATKRSSEFNSTAEVDRRPEPTRPSTIPPSANILPIQLRADLTIYIQGLPFDLSEAEARKIAAVVTALGQP